MIKYYEPERADVIWIDFEPVKGKEIGKYRPALVLSSKSYHLKSGLLICVPISTSIRGNNLEVPIEGLAMPSVVASNLVHTLDWRRRNIKLITRASVDVTRKVLQRLLPLLGVGDLL